MDVSYNDNNKSSFTVHLLSSSYSGSTLVNLLLTANEQIVDLGDTYSLPKFSTKDSRCSCGKKMVDCNFWCNILKAINRHSLKKKTWLTLQPYPLANFPLFRKGLGLIMIYVFRILPIFMIKLLFKKYIEEDEIFLQESKHLSNAKIYCDGSKYLQRVELKRKLGKPIKVIHLIREPSGYLHSCLKKYKKKSNYKFLFYRWKFYNTIASNYSISLGKENYHLIRYEALTKNPKQELEKLSHFLGIDTIKSEDLDYQNIHMTGNSVRFSFQKIEKAKEVKGNLSIEIVNFLKRKEYT